MPNNNDDIIECEQDSDGLFVPVEKIIAKPSPQLAQPIYQHSKINQNIQDFKYGFEMGINILEELTKQVSRIKKISSK